MLEWDSIVGWRRAFAPCPPNQAKAVLVQRWWARRKRAFAHPTVLKMLRRRLQANNTASAPVTASAPSITVRSSDPACTEMFSAKKRASVT